MADERLTTTETQPHATVVERRGGGVTVIAVVLLIALLIGAFFLFSRREGEGHNPAATTSAGKSIEGGLDKRR